jgi:hypothetical protein
MRVALVGGKIPHYSAKCRHEVRVAIEPLDSQWRMFPATD